MNKHRWYLLGRNDWIYFDLDTKKWHTIHHIDTQAEDKANAPYPVSASCEMIPTEQGILARIAHQFTNDHKLWLYYPDSNLVEALPALPVQNQVSFFPFEKTLVAQITDKDGSLTANYYNTTNKKWIEVPLPKLKKDQKVSHKALGFMQVGTKLLFKTSKQPLKSVPQQTRKSLREPIYADNKDLTHEAFVLEGLPHKWSNKIILETGKEQEWNDVSTAYGQIMVQKKKGWSVLGSKSKNIMPFLPSFYLLRVYAPEFVFVWGIPEINHGNNCHNPFYPPVHPPGMPICTPSEPEDFARYHPGGFYLWMK